MTLGGKDSSNCDSQWTSVVPSSSAFLGELLIETVSIKGKSFRSWQYSSIDLTTSYITAPQTVIDAVVKATGAEYDFKTDSYQVDCDKRASFPGIVFKLPTLEYHLPAVDYARRVCHHL
ncbi:ASP-1 protein [Aphelenchoides avenae]|nr:ASP-1 protein [Aphelenchus avenae]